MREVIDAGHQVFRCRPRNRIERTGKHIEIRNHLSIQDALISDLVSEYLRQLEEPIIAHKKPCVPTSWFLGSEFRARTCNGLGTVFLDVCAGLAMQ